MTFKFIQVSFKLLFTFITFETFQQSERQNLRLQQYFESFEQMHSQMTKLYNNIIDDFVTLVERQNKGKETLTNEDIERIKKSLKSKMKSPDSYYRKIIQQFFDQSVSFAQKPPIEQLEKQDEALIKVENENIKDAAFLSLKKSNSEQQEDDLNQFKKHKNSKNNHKEIQKENIESLKLNQDDLYEFDQADQDQKLTVNELNAIKEKTGLHILGTYHTKEKKFSSKKQQTKLTIYNALLKIQGHDQEVLFPVIELIAKRTSKSGLPIQ